MGDDLAFTTSKQISDYLLCRECEERFHDKGEDWVLANCYRADKSFRIQEALQATSPKYENNGVKVYSGSNVPGISSDRLVYFAASIFWRAAVHTWRHENKFHHMELGPYEECFRRFLLEEGQFPEHALLAIRVSGLDTLHEIMLLPVSITESGYHKHIFRIPGLTFILYVGKQIPRAFFDLSIAPNPEHIIAVHPMSEIEELLEMSKVVNRIRQPKGYEGL